jgi:hypothetical protein
LWKPTDVQEGRAPTEESMVAAPHSQQNPGVMRKAVSQSINRASWQANSKVTARDFWIIHDALDLIQTFPRNFGIHMNKPKNVTVRDAAASVHLYRPIALACDKLIIKAVRKINGAIRAAAVGNNNLRAGRSLAQMRKKWPYKRRLIKDRNND